MNHATKIAVSKILTTKLNTTTMHDLITMAQLVGHRDTWYAKMIMHELESRFELVEFFQENFVNDGTFIYDLYTKTCETYGSQHWDTYFNMIRKLYV